MREDSEGSSAGKALPALATAAAMAALVGAFCVMRLMSAADPPPWLYEIDLRNYFFPSLAFTKASLASGELPLWNPYQLLGSPFVATLQPAVFYPLLLPFLVLRPEHALVAHGLVHLVLAGLFTWLFLRRLGLGWLAAFCGGVAYMSSVEIADSLYNTAFLSSRAWLPALLASILAVVRVPTLRRCAVLGLVAAMILLAGSAQSAVYSFQAAAAVRALPASHR